MFCVLLCISLWLFTPKVNRLELAAKSRRGLLLIEVEVKNRWKLYNNNRRKNKYNREMYETVGFMRNLAVSDIGGNITTDALLELLIDQNGQLREIYIRTLSLLRLGHKKEAMEIFIKQVDTSMSGDFIGIIMNWDKISPKELYESLLSFQKSIKEIRLTKQKKQDEVISDVIYFPVIINVLAVFMNFIYVAYFIEQQESFEKLFY